EDLRTRDMVFVTIESGKVVGENQVGVDLCDFSRQVRSDLLSSVTQLAVAKVFLDQSRNAEDAGSLFGFPAAQRLERGVRRPVRAPPRCACKEQEGHSPTSG